MTVPNGAQSLHRIGKLLGLDHLRAFAILYVFLFHYSALFPSPEWLYTIGKFGWTGVDLFFVLSGYLISSQLFAQIDRQEAISFREFFLKRFFRIIPAYVLVVALYFLFPYLRERESPAPLWKYLSFTQNLGLDLRTQGTFSHAWSLCIEEQFYLFLPLILITLVYFKAVKKGLILLLLLFVAGFGARLYSWHTFVEPLLNSDSLWITWYKWIYYPTYSRLDGLLVGVSIAAVFQFRPRLRQWIQQYGNYWLLVGIAVLVGAYFVCLKQVSLSASLWGFPMVSLGYGLIVMGAISPTCFLYQIKSRITAQIAALSYAIYLTHKIVIHVSQEQLVKLNITEDSWLMFVLCVLTSILAALVLNKLVEKPFLKLRDKILKTTKHKVLIAKP